MKKYKGKGNYSMSNKCKIAISMGDPGGIGPEIIIKAFANHSFDAGLVVAGDLSIMHAAKDALGSSVLLNSIQSVSEANFSKKDVLNVIDMHNASQKMFASGKVSAEAGAVSVEYLIKTAELAMQSEVDAIVSAPLNKEAMQLSGCHFSGQTELLADIAETKEYAMILFFGPIKMFYATNHVPLRVALDNITFDLIIDKLRFINHTLVKMHSTNRKIAVLAVNPHAGENGKMGTEEQEIITPAIRKAISEEIEAVGPLAADTVFIKAKEGEYGAVLAMYHDQGNIAAKLLDFGAGVTYIAGLPFIRTSVAHGTAYDIAGRGIADESTLVQAINLAIKLAGERSGLS